METENKKSPKNGQIILRIIIKRENKKYKK